MSKKCIGFGTCWKSYKYLLFVVILKGLDENLLNFTSVSPQVKVYITGINPVLSNHIIVQNSYKYISFIIGGIISKFIIRINIKKTRKSVIYPINNLLQEQKLIHNQGHSKKLHIPDILIVSFIIVLNHELFDILYTFQLINLYIWTFDIIFILFFMKKNFIFKLYNFQKCSFIFVIIINSILLTISVFMPVTEDESQQLTSYDIIELLTGSKYYALLIFVFTSLLSFIISYGTVKFKVLTDLKYISLYTFIIFIGIIGTLITAIELYIDRSFQCGEKIKNFCMAESTDKSRYFDDIIIYLNSLGDKKVENSIEFYLEIFLLTPVFMLINFLEMVCHLSIIIYLNPIFVLIENNFCYFIDTLLFGIFNKEDAFMNAETIIQFCVSEIAEVIAIICFMICLQIIELRFCGLDTFLYKNLLILSESEFKQAKEAKESMEEQEEEVEKSSENTTIISEQTFILEEE